MAKKILIVLGAPGSGKSTQADLICKEFNYEHIIESDLLKQEILKKTPLSKKIAKIMNEGKLVPYEITCDILFKKIKKSKKNKIVIDGFPREINQAIVFDYFVFSENIDFLGIVYLSLSKESSVKRLLLRKRKDDTKKIIQKRLEIYYKETKPVIERYKKQKKLIEIDGEPSIEEIFKNVKNKLKNKSLKEKIL
ncbi:MAG TPA: nucleoside monophosphate kinase [archaeon]|nr:nucleoside monophosphate kinase [archaeon]HRT02864.1 nucleoside monophosphate kinase [Candidatus Diapherotrites archaeon]